MPTGIKIFNVTGELHFETGTHVLATVPKFAEKIGEIAVAWAVTEGHLGCYYGSLLETTPNEALKKIGRMSAAGLANNAKKFAEEKLAGAELETILYLLKKLDSVRIRRNRIQHDIWSRRVTDPQVLYAVHVDDYRRLLHEMAKLGNETDPAVSADRAIDIANQYAANSENAFTLVDLEEIRANLELTSDGLFKAFISKVSAGG
ncbi:MULTISPECIES: hypothetical protein [Roseobacteraceae]|uniref:hypothetical protein n=1 Tax=Roseobacteraceae TaxID=2854170 RepID=UPI0031CF475A